MHFSSIQDQFDKILYVPIPSPKERGQILENLARNRPIDADVDLMALGKSVACQNFNGDDLFALVRIVLVPKFLVLPMKRQNFPY